MKKVEDIVSRALECHVVLYVKEGRLAYTASADGVPDELRAEIAAHKEGIIQYLSNLAVPGEAAGWSVERAPRDAELPLSYQQEQVWMAQTIDDRGQFNIANAFEYQGPLDEVRLEHALRRVIRRHDVLRTVYEGREGRVLQRLLDGADFRIVVHDLSDLDEAGWRGALQGLLAVEQAMTFDLAAEFPLRVTCYRRSATLSVISIVIHHIASDGRSQEILVSEIASAYRSTEETAEPNAYGYGDYAWSQREALAGGRMDREKAIWAKRLQGVSTAPALPVDLPRPKVFTGTGGAIESRFDGEETARIVAFARKRNVTMFMLLESVLALLLGRWTRSPDVVVGSPVAGRDQDGMQDVMGLFVNVLPLRSACPSEGPLSSFLDGNKVVLTEAFAASALPLGIMLDALGVEASRGHSPLFQAVFNLQPVMDAGISLDGGAMVPLAQDPLIKYDLEVVALQGRDTLSLSWKYADTLFTEATIARLADAYREVLLGACVEDDVDVSSLPFGDLGSMSVVADMTEETDEAATIIGEAFPGYAVACIRSGSAVTSRCVAYVLPLDGHSAEDMDACRSQAIDRLRDVLGDKAIPDAWSLLDESCRDSRGGIDRKRLPRVVFPPRSEHERHVAAIWAELLECQEVGLTDDFFDLGGNSIRAMRVTAKVSEAFGVQMQIRDLFERSVLADYATLVMDKAVAGGVTIGKRPQADRVALSFAQERLWFLDQLNGGSAEYNMPAIFRIDGRFDTDLAERAMNLIIARHEVLRTVYLADVDGVAQHVLEPDMFRLERTDLSHLSSAAAEMELRRLVGEDISRPFDLSAGPMVRAGYYRLDDIPEGGSRGVLFFNIHHVACDGWSLDLLVNEFVTAYRTMAEGIEPGLPDLPIQYGDYAHWQRAWLGTPSFDRQLDYWLAHLDGVPAVHSLHLDHPRPQVKGYVGECVAGSVDRATSDALDVLARRFQLTPFMLMHAALALVLARHGNMDDVVMGTPVANRQQAQTEDLIGFFINTLVLRVRPGQETIESYLGHIRQVHLDAQSNQDVPFELLVERLGMPRTTQHTPLFQVMFTSDADYGLKREGDERALLHLPGANICTYDFEGFAAKFDLEVNVSATNDGIAMRWTYDVGIFDRRTVERLNDHLARTLVVLAALASDDAAPDMRLRDLPMLSPAEMQFLLRPDVPVVPWPKDRCIHQLFLEQVERTPDAVALEAGGTLLTFRQLATRSAAIAERLRTMHGISTGSLVGICLERDVDMPASVLGVLQAGAAYVPLDPAYPVGRLSHIVRDAGMAVVICQTATAARLDGVDCLRVVLDDPSPREAVVVTTAEAVASPADLAYVIYTSGSTGLPKGVAITHANAVSMLYWAKSAYADDELARVLASTSLSFDLSVFELFVPLCFGYRCVLVRDALSLVEQTVDVTLINTVPSAIRVLLDSNAIPAGTRTVNLAGEPLPRQIVNELLARGACRSVCNLYGPSEDTTYSTAARFDAPLADDVPIGRVIANSQGLVLSEGLALLPPGVIGELYLSGAGVARGYLGNEALTASRFLANPHHDVGNPHSGPVLYRTGDLVRYDESGQLHFVGRCDSQVKLHGFRIELSEIEQQICRHGWVDSAVVVVHETASGTQELLAYVKPIEAFAEGTDRPLAFALKEDLGQFLPGYMVPSVILLVEAWPLSPNGKIDRKALPKPDTRIDPVTARAPSSDMEERLLGIWESLLSRSGFGVDMDFFALGGNSLSLTRLHSQIKAECGINVPVRTLFGHRTIAAQALIIESFQATRSAEELLTADVTEEEL